ncbi:putative pyruvate dehydrogenase [Jackrogersella minutella]|nr:putative pyruvate dehydrogenase [Jackrogersella minutella]
MLPSRVAQMRLGRVTSRSILSTQGKGFFTTNKRTYPAANISKVVGYTMAAGVVSVPGIWWLAKTRDQVPRLQKPYPNDSVVESGPSTHEVTRIISQEAYQFSVKNVAGVSRYDGTQVSSNSPCEDRFIHCKFPSPWNDGSQWMAWAVFDGHAGWQTADLLERKLLPIVRHTLSQIGPKSRQSVSEEDVQCAIMKAFVDLDDSIMQPGWSVADTKEPWQDKVKKLIPAFAGSCALLSLYDPISTTLHVACTGDSRAVLAQQGPDGKWEAIPLSIDQTGKNKDEIERLNKEHPGETDVVKDGRVLGLVISRAFGDSRWKWPLKLQKDLFKRFHGHSPFSPSRYDVRTPPYITAEPVVISTKINPDKPSFLIMASDGLWDFLTNEQAVGLVGKWLESQATGEKQTNVMHNYKPIDFSDLLKGINWKFEEHRTTVQDDNAAVHLARNSLGGNNHQIIAGRLAYDAPFSRYLRDDMTVQVVFFNQPELAKGRT